MKKFGVLGHNIAYSLSPQIHKMIFDACGLWGYSYEIIDMDYGQLSADGLRAYAGFNVTVPYKKTIIDFLDENCSRVEGSVNTVKNIDGRLTGYNTDAYGFLKDITHYATLAQNKAAVLGAGGAARAVCSVLKEAGCDFRVFARRPDAAEALADFFSVSKRLSGYRPGIVIVCTGQQTTLAEISKLTDTGDIKIVYDLSYRYSADPAFEKIGIRYVSGKGMLVHQALEAAKIFYGLNMQETEYGQLFEKIYDSIKVYKNNCSLNIRLS